MVDGVDSVAVRPSRRRRGQRGVGWSEALGRKICARVAQGEPLYQVLRRPGMPTPQSVGRWARERPAFGAELEAARRAGGRPGPGGGGVWSYCPETAHAIYDRICEGESVTRICRDPDMPCFSTIYYWRRRFVEFDELMRRAYEIRADRLCDLGWEMAEEATPETAYVTDVRLKQLRWMVGCMSPRRYRTKAVEPEAAREELTVVIRRFETEVDPQTGERRVVAFYANPVTGQVEREDTPGWRPPPGAVAIPAG